MKDNVASMTVTPSREARVGELLVRRALPRRGRRTIGAWCFADHMGPIYVSANRGVDVGPHPHMGLQTVTWLIEGTQLHRDSLGSEQLISAGELNLMTAGRGVAHSEEATPLYEGTLQGIQLWIAQPDATRNGPAAFHHFEDLPRVKLSGGVGTVLIGQYGEHASPAPVATPLFGMEVDVARNSVIALNRKFEYGLIVLEGAVGVDGEVVIPGQLGYLAQGREELVLEVPESTRVMLLGGEPWEEGIEMWWNFVGRDRNEFVSAYQSWEKDDDRFGTVASSLDRIFTTPPTPRAGLFEEEVVDR